MKTTKRKPYVWEWWVLTLLNEKSAQWDKGPYSSETEARRQCNESQNVCAVVVLPPKPRRPKK